MDTSAERFNRHVGAEMRLQIDLRSDLTISGVSRVTGIERSTLGRYLAGTRPVPVSAVKAVADAVGVPPEHIVRVARLRLEDEAAIQSDLTLETGYLVDEAEAELKLDEIRNRRARRGDD